jgi:hypothetical protein
MAVLTWRNVDAPRGGNGEIAGLATAAGLLSRGTDGLSDALGKFGQAQTDLADNAALQAASRLQTADGLRTALGDGSLLGSLQGVDPTRVSAATLGALQKGVGDRVTNDLHTQQAAAAILKGQYDQARTGKTQFDLGVEQRNQSALNAAQPVINEIQIRRNQGDEAGARALENDPSIRPLLQAVDPTKYGELSRGSLEGFGKTVSNSQGTFNFEKGVREQTNDLQASRLAGYIQSLNTDEQGARDQLDKLGIPAEVQALVGQKLGKKWDITPGPAGSGGVLGSGGSVSPGSGANPMRLTLGGGQADPTINTVGDVVDNGKTLADAHKTQDGVGHSNVGPFQITAPTWKDFAPKALGSDWRKADINDFATHDKVGSAIWDTVKNNPSAMVGRWTSLSPAEAQALKGADWNQAREVIAKGESSTSPAAIQTASFRPGSVAPAEQGATPAGNAIAKATAADFPTIDALREASNQSKSLNNSLIAGSQQRDGQNIANTGIKAADYLAAQSDGSSAKQVANRLTAKGGAFEGEDSDKVLNWVNDIQQRSVQLNAENKAVAQLSAATAGVMLASGNGVIKGGGIGSGILSGLKPNTLKSGSYYDPAAAANLVGAFNAGEITKASAVMSENKQVQDSLTSAQQALDAVTDKITKTQQSADNAGREIPDDVKQRLASEYTRAKARRDKSQERLNGANAQQTNVSAAAQKRNADAAAEAARQVRMRDALDAASDPTKNPLLLTSGM